MNTGKYTLNADYTAETCLITSSTGVCTSIKQNNFKKDDLVDVIEVQELFGQTQGKVFVGIYDYFIPSSKLTAYIKPSINTNTGAEPGSTTTSEDENLKTTFFKKYVTKTNVIIALGVLIITGILLKIFKVF